MSIEEQDAKTARERIAELESQCAVMREALEQRGCEEAHVDPCGAVWHCSSETPMDPCRTCRALTSDAGKALLEQLETAERLAEMGGLSAADVRNRALEEAAKVADELADIEDGDLVGHAIRALKEKP